MGGFCVCWQALTIKLKAGYENLSIEDIEAAIDGHNEWSRLCLACVKFSYVSCVSISHTVSHSESIHYKAQYIHPTSFTCSTSERVLKKNHSSAPPRPAP